MPHNNYFAEKYLVFELLWSELSIASCGPLNSAKQFY